MTENLLSFHPNVFQTNRSGLHWSIIDVNETNSTSPDTYIISLILSCLYTILLFPLGLMGNILILLVNFDPRQRMSTPDLYFTNLALADLVLVLDSLIEVFNLSEHYYDDAVLCSCMALFLQVNMYSSVFWLTWMSLDRCLALTGLRTRALPENISVTHRTRLAQRACGTIWVAATLCTLIPFAMAHIHHGWGRGFCFAGVAEVQWLEVTLGFALPFCVMGVCYAHIARMLLRSERPRRTKALRMIVAAVTVFFVCWLPENVFISVHLLSGDSASRRRGNHTLWQRYPLTGHVVTLAACANSCLNPLVYSLLGNTFRHKLQVFVAHHVRCLHTCIQTANTTPPCPCVTCTNVHHSCSHENKDFEERDLRSGEEGAEGRECVCDRVG
ncbi:G-protein coupled estrogen receptor 1 G protein-coupled estrogen receptor 1 [Triplophysa tibetana]|uniref:G-protein coupled estrogen receptor 1 n=1 Tax=Triplophysa tibetana TaxID=1572043 RepID=A0A5A9N4U0_9TELE|nr:G-protein coupled estrogen receptor 1 G protein-coupled estrogen receptor 1 [Triplophysa tibetana]